MEDLVLVDFEGFRFKGSSSLMIVIAMVAVAKLQLAPHMQRGCPRCSGERRDLWIVKHPHISFLSLVPNPNNDNKDPIVFRFSTTCSRPNNPVVRSIMEPVKSERPSTASISSQVFTFVLPKSFLRKQCRIAGNTRIVEQTNMYGMLVILIGCVRS